MAVFAVFLNVAGQRVEVGSVALDNPNLSEFKSVELIQQDAEPEEDAMSLEFAPAVVV